MNFLVWISVQDYEIYKGCEQWKQTLGSSVIETVWNFLKKFELNIAIN